MHPVCLYIGTRPIYWYGVMMAAAFLAGMTHLRSIGRRDGRDSAYCADLVFWVMLAGIIGARVAYVFGNLSYYAENPIEILRVDRGGLVYYGGFLGAGAALWLFARVKRERTLAVLDFMITAVPLGHAFGRVGCFLNGCCYGRPGTEPWCVVSEAVDKVPRHPVQLYEAAANLVLYAVLLIAYRRRKRDGQIVSLYLLTYPIGRFLFEYFRGDERVRLPWGGITLAQASSIALFLTGVAIWSATRRHHDATHG